MKKQKNIFLFAVLISTVTFSVLGETQTPVPSTQVIKHAQQTAKPAAKPAATTAIPTISLYASPETTAKITETLPANSNLVGIFRHGDWMKVGNRKDGAVGWINLPQYHQVLRAYYHNYYRNYFHSSDEMIYVHSTKDKNGKTIIEAYRNGKKLSEADAKKLYNQAQTQARLQWQSMEKFNQQMDDEMQRDYQQAMRAF